MKPDIFATQALRPRDQLEAWREWYSSVFEVAPKDPMGIGFSGETRLWNLGGLLMSRTIAPPGRVVRTAAHLRRDPADHWVISYCVRGGFLVKTLATEVEVPARMPFLWSLRQELSYERTHVDWVQFFLARDTFRDVAPLLDAACGSVLDTPLGHLLGDYMIALETRLPDVTETDFAGATKALGAMVAAAAAPSVERRAVAKPQIDLSRKERVRQAVRRHLRTPTLEPKTLGRLVGMSRSNLYRLLEEEGGVARYIQHQRLLEAQAALSDPATTQSISTIAEDLCFGDASSFSRTFKREFGYSPSKARSAARAGLTPAAAPKSRVLSNQADFAELLRGF
jgi:AraC-like DNA-binding protein